MKLKKIIFIAIGCITLGLGTLGVILPILPTVPFFMLTLICFANSSDKLKNWFIGTKLYKNHLESYVQQKGMTFKTKISIILTVTVIMAASCVIMLMKGIYIPCIIIGIVWICHILYFSFGVRTIK